ncbi:FAD-dependent oxidoreductase [Methanobrevibacter sp. TMH8]|uniref:GMC family oxidoreductase N-terminal domain-containing protein n=1 Tax=Methanobrevibacter sp. TMH8 TaxID=2848611 RepID=UPI001CCF942A|nr:GMC family oxidoreductase N-terminal domain-containing protein [Methanobrevibacter sp. TMH8]MBZ9570194.1 FAD-dependent oxidoreductase [Methanobrevibacter sp. TMH8]
MVLIVGSGVGGAIIGMELAKSNIPVTIVEKGPFCDVKDSYKYYDEIDDYLDLSKTVCVGGSSVVAAGNGVKLLEEELAKYDVDISKELDEVEELIGIHEMDDSHFGKGTKKFMEAAKSIGLPVVKMPKFIREEDCTQCGKCAWGCPNDAKWSSQDFVKIAIENGAKLIDNTEVTEIIEDGGSVKGVKVKNSDGSIDIIESDIVVLAAGGIDSAIILQNSGIAAGEKLFMDPFVTVGGVIKDINYNTEVTMNALVVGGNFVLAPHYSILLNENIGDDDVKKSDILSIMVKIPDDNHGKIIDGEIIKENTIKDVRFIAEGAATAGAILVAAGVDPTTIVSTRLRGAHPGGTAAIGDIVDTNLETEYKGLFVSDASVIPEAPGAPPIVAILALSKRLSKYLIENI